MRNRKLRRMSSIKSHRASMNKLKLYVKLMLNITVKWWMLLGTMMEKRVMLNFFLFLLMDPKFMLWLVGISSDVSSKKTRLGSKRPSSRYYIKKRPKYQPRKSLNPSPMTNRAASIICSAMVQPKGGTHDIVIRERHKEIS
jgi:hypothetical protein